MKILPSGAAVLDVPDSLSEWTVDLSVSADAALGAALTKIQPGDCVIDGGAALGDHTFQYLSRVSPAGRVIAFEPHPSYFECLTHNCPTAECHNKALWDASTTVTLSDSSGNHGASYVSIKAAPACEKSWSVETVAIDELILERLDFIKLDIEGAEFRALTGAKKTIKKHRPAMVIEVNEAMLIRQGASCIRLYELLRELGYAWHVITGNEECGDLILTPVW